MVHARKSILGVAMLALAGGPGCGPEAVALPDIGETRCYVDGAGPTQPILPVVLGANGEPVHCTTEVNGYATFSQDACFPDRMEAAGFEEAEGWTDHGCDDAPALIVPDRRGWEEIRCWYLAYLGEQPTGGTCFALAHGRWIAVYPPCTPDEVLTDPFFVERDLDELCPADDPAALHPDAFCYDEADPDPDADVHYRGCMQPVGETWISLFTSCSVDAWSPTPESDACAS